MLCLAILEGTLQHSNEGSIFTNGNAIEAAIIGAIVITVDPTRVQARADDKASRNRVISLGKAKVNKITIGLCL